MPSEVHVLGILSRMYGDGRNDLPTCDWIQEVVRQALSAPNIRPLASDIYKTIEQFAANGDYAYRPEWDHAAIALANKHLTPEKTV